MKIDKKDFKVVFHSKGNPNLNISQEDICLLDNGDIDILKSFDVEFVLTAVSVYFKNLKIVRQSFLARYVKSGDKLKVNIHSNFPYDEYNPVIK